MKPLLYRILTIGILASCNLGKKSTPADIQVESEKVRFSYYNPVFKLDPATKLRTVGYYLIEESFGSHTTNGTDYQLNQPAYGYVQFFADGFCRLGPWNGIFESPSAINDAIEENTIHGFWGIYKVKADTLFLEYLYINPATIETTRTEERKHLTGLIRENGLTVLEHDHIRYGHFQGDDSPPSSCIGRFVKIDTDYSKLNNILKSDIGYYQ